MILRTSHAASLWMLTLLGTVIENRCVDTGLVPFLPPAEMHVGHRTHPVWNLWVLNTGMLIPGAKIFLVKERKESLDGLISGFLSQPLTVTWGAFTLTIYAYFHLKSIPLISQEFHRAQPGIQDFENNENKAFSALYQQWDSQLWDAAPSGSQAQADPARGSFFFPTMSLRVSFIEEKQIPNQQ